MKNCTRKKAKDSSARNTAVCPVHNDRLDEGRECTMPVVQKQLYGIGGSICSEAAVPAKPRKEFAEWVCPLAARQLLQVCTRAKVQQTSFPPLKPATEDDLLRGERKQGRPILPQQTAKRENVPQQVSRETAILTPSVDFSLVSPVSLLES